MKLYEIADEYLTALRDMREAGLDDDIIEDSLACIKDDLEQKAVAVVKHSMNVQADVDALDNEIKRLQAKKKTLVSNQNWVKDYLARNMIASDITRIECPEFTISLRKPTVVASVVNGDTVPMEYKTVEEVVKIDKRKLLADLKTGAEIEGAELSTGKQTVTIR